VAMGKLDCSSILIARELPADETWYHGVTSRCLDGVSNLEAVDGNPTFPKRREDEAADATRDPVPQSLFLRVKHRVEVSQTKIDLRQVNGRHVPLFRQGQ
jgi:hypothetical protein